MPLIIIAGRPCVGKTSFAERLKEFLLSQGLGQDSVVLVNEESLRIPKKDGYANSNREKDLRGSLKSAVDHALTPGTYVILDSLNYIKGFRYELYCQARTNRSTHCVVWVACDQETSIQRNKDRQVQSMDAYDESILKELWKRFEMPNENNRWDRPLFKVVMGGAASSTANAANNVAPTVTEAAVASFVESASTPATEPAHAPASVPVPTPTPTVFKSSWKPKSKKVAEVVEAEKVVSPPPIVAPAVDLSTLTISGSVLESEDFSSFRKPEEVFEDIFSHLSTATTYIPNCSTVTPLHAQADMLYELDRTSQKILSMIVAHQTDCVQGTPIQLVDYDRALSLHRHVSLSELQRFRRQFVKINAQHPPSSSREIGSSFVDYLAANL